MYQDKLIEDVEVTVNEVAYNVDLTATAKLVDGSFTHDFGTEYLTAIEMEGIEVETGYNEEGDIVINSEIIKAIARNISQEDYLDHFEGSDFEG